MTIKCQLFWLMWGLSYVFYGIQNTSADRRIVRSPDNSFKTTPGSFEVTSEAWKAAAAEDCADKYYTDVAQEYENERQGRSDSKTHSIRAATSTEIPVSRLSDKFINCPLTTVEPGCYYTLNNGSVAVPAYNRLFNNTDYIIYPDGLLGICTNFTDNNPPGTNTFATGISVVSIVGMAISTICILLHMAMFLYLEKKRNLPGYCLFTLCVALLVTYACSYSIPIVHDNTECFPISMVLFYFLLASFFWMNVMSFDIWRSLRRATTKLRLSGDRPILIRFAMYSTYAWGGPLLILIIALIVDCTTDDEEYQLIFANDTCWFEYKTGLFLYFALPFMTLLIVNVALFISSFYMINTAMINTAENKADLWSRFFISLRLAVAMGLMWIFGVLASALQVSALWYFYALCNALQGVCIFFSFTFTERTRRAFRFVMERKNPSLVPSSQTSSS